MQDTWDDQLLANGKEIRKEMRDMYDDNRVTSVGTYINLWVSDDSGYDVFITLNEANDPPTPEEIDEIENKIRPIFESDEKEKRKVADHILNNLDLKCLEYGGEVIVVRERR